MKQVKKGKGFQVSQIQQVNKKQAEQWFNQMTRCLPSNCKPDAGHRFYREGVMNPTIVLSGRCMLLPDKMGIQICSVSGAECVSILMKMADALKLFPSDSMPTKKNYTYYDLEEHCCVIECQLAPNLRYQTANGEFVLPMIGTPKARQQ